MPPPPTASPVTGQPIPPHYIHSSSAHFRLNDGRTILLRGINLASSAKTPRGQPGWKKEGFWEGAKSGEMSFRGRVLELDEADEHLERLRSWGFNTLRFVTTWESIEHGGPYVHFPPFPPLPSALRLTLPPDAAASTTRSTSTTPWRCCASAKSLASSFTLILIKISFVLLLSLHLSS